MNHNMILKNIKKRINFLYPSYNSTRLLSRIKSVMDYNKNNIPDFIEDLGLQLQTANNTFSKKINLVKPLENYRYKDKVTYIDIHVLKLKKGQNGSAGDAIIKYNYINFKNGKIFKFS